MGNEPLVGRAGVGVGRGYRRRHAPWTGSAPLVPEHRLRHLLHRLPGPSRPAGLPAAPIGPQPGDDAADRAELHPSRRAQTRRRTGAVAPCPTLVTVSCRPFHIERSVSEAEAAVYWPAVLRLGSQARAELGADRVRGPHDVSADGRRVLIVARTRFRLVPGVRAGGRRRRVPRRSDLDELRRLCGLRFAAQRHDR